MVDFKNIFSAVSIVTSIFALFISAKNWRESNRPIVTAIFDTDTGNVSTLIEMILFNSGSRPAIDIVLYADKNQIENILDKNAPATYRDNINKIFSGRNIIPILHNASEIKNAFGIASKNEQNTFIWNSKIQFYIRYKDLSGKKYETKQVLEIKNYSSFAGHSFRKAND